MNSKNGLILWVLGAAGVFFIYSAYKGLSPTAVLSGYFTGIPAIAAATIGPSFGNGGSFAGPPVGQSFGNGGSFGPTNGNGVNISHTPIAYQRNPANQIPLRGMRIPY